MIAQTAINDDDLPCAWCNAERGIPQGNGSHGICQKHKELVELNYQQDRFDRIPSFVKRFKGGYVERYEK